MTIENASSSSSEELLPVHRPVNEGSCCGFLGKEVIVLGVWALIGCAIVAVGVAGIVGAIHMGFGVAGVTVTSTITGGCVTGIGGLALLAMLYGVCFFCQRKTNRNKTTPLGS